MNVLCRPVLSLPAVLLLLAACGDDTTTTGSDGGGDPPTVVVTTTALGDVVENLAGDQFEVVTIMPSGADPHDFQASARQVDQMREADALIVNGAGLEEGLLDVIESAENDGVPTFEAIAAVETIEFGDGGHAHEEEHSEEDHSDGDGHDHEGGQDHEGGDDHAHSHEGVDPHFFLDPSRMSRAVEGIDGFLAETVEGIDVDALGESASAYGAELEALDDEVEALLSGIDDDGRALVTNHDAFGYFAERYHFEVVGTAIPSGSTADGASPGDLAELAEIVQDEGVRAIFAETTASDELVRTLADEVGGEVAVVELFSDSLGEPGSDGGTYTGMIRTNAQRIADALGQ